MPRIRSRTLDITLIIVGAGCVMIAYDTWLSAFRNEGWGMFSGATFDGVALFLPRFWFLVGLWCFFGGIASIRREPL